MPPVYAPTYAKVIALPRPVATRSFMMTRMLDILLVTLVFSIFW